MKQQFNMEGHAIMVPLFTVYALAILGSVLGGGFPMLFMNKGMEAYKARLTAMLIIAILPVSLLTTPYFGNVSIFGGQAYIYALIVICIAAAAHQAWSCNIFTTVSDMFPKKAVGSVTGIGGLAGGLGGVLIQQIAGRLTDHYKGIGEAAAVVKNLTGDAARMLVQSHVQTAYGIMFGLCALSYLIAWGCIKILVPKFQPITDL
jgi:ACS family hexuronate transporter-like MFS transporter